MRCRMAPQSGHASCSGGTSCRTGLRGRLAGSGFRPWPFFLGLGVPGGSGGSGTASGSGVGSGSALPAQDFLSEEQELSGIDPLALPAIALAEELFELMLEFGVEMKLLAERLQQLADELMGRLDVVRERVARVIIPYTT